MIFTEQDLDNLSHLARIDITGEEKAKMLADMQAILGYVSVINETQGESSPSYDIVNVVREDVVTSETASHTEAILREAPATQDGYVEVIQVLK